MTPLVDLAFLLLTFFLLQTSIVKPHIVQLTMPEKDNQHAYGEYHFSGVITIMLGRNHNLHYYYGLNNPFDEQVPVPEIKSTDFSAQGIRQVLLTQHESLSSFFLILIKPAPGATYKDIVDILDEMNITAQKKYALVHLSAADRQLLLANGKQ